MTNYDDMKFAVEALSGGNNTVLLDDIGMPSVVVPFPKLKYADVIAGGSQNALPAFIVDGEEVDVIYASKYQNIIVNDRAYSLPLKDPAVSVNFDKALTACRNKGAGWHLQTNALWAAIALWCRKNGTMPRGNNHYGQCYTNTYEKGIPTALETDGRISRTATGSGPVSWYHNYDASGIYGLHGNVWEWCSGLRLKNGEIQVIPNGDAMLPGCDMSDASAQWKAILQNGTFVAPGTANTFKIDGDTPGSANTASTKIGGLVLDTKIVNPTYTGSTTNSLYGYLMSTFESFTAASGVTVPPLLAALGLFPNGTGHEGANIWARNYGERVAYRGGSWNCLLTGGVFALNLYHARTSSGSGIGLRASYYGK